MSSTGEKKASEGLSSLNTPATKSAQQSSSAGRDDESTQQTQSEKAIHESAAAQSLQEDGESAKADPRWGPAHDTKQQPSHAEPFSGHATALAPSDTAEGDQPPRQVIAVSASKGPAAFFNLARKFLVTDEMCDLSALEGAIVSAVDAAHLLERSQLATIVRVHTSYVSVEPKRKKQVIEMQGSQEENLKPVSESSSTAEVSTESLTVEKGATSQPPESQTQSSKNPPPQKPKTQPPQRNTPGGRELRRARIVITVKRTESYKQWLLENPLQAIIAGGSDDTEDEEGGPETSLAASAASAQTPS
ncbi:unnamed protein product [Cylindrotheca closterium]|uniref:Uncharacterized protein n=1 Tax=Cylindrotheca closterium TaxID=2856 RepID=A0AAD2CKT6_9STRA|nr:unnamed protein product [Cylindrotheca closterium]